MIGTFFVSLFKINEQADHYWLQAAKLKEEQLKLRAMYKPFRYKHWIDTNIHKIRMNLGISFKEFEQGCVELQK